MKSGLTTASLIALGIGAVAVIALIVLVHSLMPAGVNLARLIFFDVVGAIGIGALTLKIAARLSNDRSESPEKAP